VMKDRKCIQRMPLPMMLVLALLLTMILAPCGTARAGTAAFKTTGFNVRINVNTDNTATVDEEITLSGSAIDTLTRRIPARSVIVYRDDAGKTIKTVRTPVRVENIHVENDSFTVKRRPGSRIVTIKNQGGNAKGKKTYHLSYELVCFDDTVNSSDCFSSMVLPQDWETAIDKAVITLTMPKKFARENVKIEAVQGNENLGSDGIKTSIQGRTITSRTTRTLSKGTGIKAEINLPEGYFQGERSAFLYRIMIIAGCLLLSIILALLWYRFGRAKRSFSTVEKEPPDAMTPPEAGYILDGVVGAKDLVSMVLWFCDRGYASIKEEGKDWRICRMQDLPAEQVKDYQKTFFDGLFAAGDGDSVTLEALKKQDCLFSRAAAKQLIEYFSRNRKRRIFPGKVTMQRAAACLVTVAGFLMVLFGVHSMSGDLVADVLVIVAAGLCFAGGVAGIGGDGRRNLLSWLLLAVSLALLGWMLIGRLHVLVAGLLVLLFAAASYLVVRFMGGRTRYGNEALQRLLGFREYIRMADGEKLVQEAENNPYYYSNMLPYAYVLGTAKKWSKKFEPISTPLPDWYASPLLTEENFDTWAFFRRLAGFTKALAAALAEIEAKDTLSAFGGLRHRKADDQDAAGQDEETGKAEEGNEDA